LAGGAQHAFADDKDKTASKAESGFFYELGLPR